MNPEDKKNTADLTKPKNTLGNIFSSALFYLTILLFIIGFNFSDRMAGNWYQQFLPNIGGRTITDVFFLDSLTGWSVTNATNQVNDTIYVLKTTNSGNNWSIQYSKIQVGGGFSGYFKVYFLDQNTGYTSDVFGIYKTTDGGSTWASLNAPSTAYTDMSVLNTDTIWIVTSDSFAGGVFRTTNAGASWENQLDLGSQNPDHVYFYNGRIGFTGEYGGTYLRKTTNSGLSWTVVESGGFNGFSDMYFIDSLIGYRAISTIKKTTDGGNSWVSQTIPFGGQIITSNMGQFTVLNKDTLWGVGGQIFYGGSQTRGILFRTTNGGANWLFQTPDTAYNNFNYYYPKFTDKSKGWAYTPIKGVHTTTGGDPVWITPVSQTGSEVPKEYLLGQNYPNPFNPVTNIKYSVKSATGGETSNVKLLVFDIQGKQLTELINQNQSAGTYQVDFNGSNYSSGLYFYSLIIDGKIIDTKKMMLLK